MEYSKENVMTRKEYLKSKKKNKFSFKFLKYALLIVTIILLGIYVFKQLNVYNNVTKMANKVVEETALAKTMTMYFVSYPYSKDGKSSVMLYKSYDESRTKIEGSEDFQNIKVVDNKLYGIVENKMYVIDLTTLEKNDILEENINEYYVLEDKIYFSNDSGIYLYDTTNDKLDKIIDKKVENFIIQDGYIYIIAPSKTSKSIIKYNLNGKGKLDITEREIVSKMCVVKDKIYYINSSDNNKVYMVNTNGKKNEKVVDARVTNNNLVATLTDVYFTTSEDNILKKVNIKSSKEETLIKKNIQNIKIIDNILYYNISGDLGIYRINLETNKKEKITSVRTNEYICIN